MEILIPFENEEAASIALGEGKYGVVKQTRNVQPDEGVDATTFDLTSVYATPEDAKAAADQLNETEGGREIQAPYGHPEVKPYEMEDFVDELTVKFTTGAVSLRGAEVMVTPVENPGE